MGQGMRVTVDAAMRARDVSRIRPQDEAPLPAEDPSAEPSQPAPQPTRLRRAERRRLAKRRAAETTS
ncbi:hypothetical protein [Actinoallomurus acaciae]|uniref:Uncharacterized protein n=1 Tax=Actinoallomurus acaciae TaxID=502577 RepID=A0ABV5YDS0_9ACTN